jgi:hypothetical protein
MKVPRLLFMITLILVLFTAACGADEGTVIIVETTTPIGGDLTGTPSAAVSTGVAETATGISPVVPDNTATLAVIDDAGSQATAVSSPAAGSTRAPGIPVTGSEIVLVECQFCVDSWAQALLVLPDTATFQVVSPDPAVTTSTADMQPSCLTVEVNNGRQVVLCSGPEMTPITLNICTDVNTCTDFPVELLACPVTTQQQPGAIPNQTQPAEPDSASATATSTTP